MLTCRDNPMYNCPDDTVCYTCHSKLPGIKENANLDFDDEQYFAFEGFCSAACAAKSVAQSNMKSTDEFAQRLYKRIALAEHELRNAQWNAVRQGRKISKTR